MNLRGLSFVVTGKLNVFQTREELKNIILSYGGKLTTTVSPKTTALITNTPHTNTVKNKKARDIGVEVISEDEFISRYLSFGHEEIPKTDITISDNEGNRYILDNEVLIRCENICDTISIPEEVSVIGESAFAGCSNVETIIIPSTVKKIEKMNAFIRLDNLCSIVVDQNNLSYASDSGLLYTKSYDQLLACPRAKTGCIVIPDSVKSILFENEYVLHGVE